MTKLQAKVIAQIMIAKTAASFDGFAFEDCDPELSEDEVNKIMNEIQKISDSTISRVCKKYGLNFENASRVDQIIDEVLYE